MTLILKGHEYHNGRASRLAGILLMLLSFFMFCLGDAIGKFMVSTYAVGQLLLLRACAALIMMSPMLYRQRAAFFHVERPWLLLGRTALATVEVAAFFIATVYLPLADVITFYLAGPIFVTALSAVLLGERVDARRWSAIIIGFVGVVIAMRPSAQTISLPALIALGGSIAFAALMLMTRSMRATPGIVLTGSQFLGTFSLGAVMTPFNWVTPDAASLALFVAGGFTGVTGQLLAARSLKLAPASVVAPYQYSMIIWAVLFGFLMFGDTPSLQTIAGAAIITGAGLYIFLRERNAGQTDVMEAPPG